MPKNDIFQSVKDTIQVLLSQGISATQYSPENKGLDWNEYEAIRKTNSIVRKLVINRKSIVGANGWNIHCSLYRSEKKNDFLASEIYYRLQNSIKIDKLKSQFAALTGTYGNCYGIFDKDNLPIVKTPDNFEQYYDYVNEKSIKYAMKIDGREQRGALGNFQEGVDIFHFKDQLTSHQSYADSPIDSCYGWILLYEHALQINNNMISGGSIGTLVALFEKEYGEYLNEKDDKGVYNGEKILKAFREKIGGAVQYFTGQRINKQAQSHKLAFLTGAKELLELGRTNQDMQLSELIEKAESAIYSAFGETKTTENTTYSNAKTFNYQLYDLIGRDAEEHFADYVNTFLLPHYGMETGKDLYFSFDPAVDPDETENKNFLLAMTDKAMNYSTNKTFKAKVYNELRDKVGLEPIDESLFETDEVAVGGRVIEAKSVESFANSQTPIEKALASRDYFRLEADSKNLKKN